MLDIAAAGINQAATGEQTNTFFFEGTKKTAKGFGASEEEANNIAIGTDIVVGAYLTGGASNVKNLGTIPKVVAGGGVAIKGVSTEMTTVGRWMSKGEYAAMKNGTTVLEGAGGQTFVTQGGSHLFSGATRGSVYAEFQVPTNSLLQGGKQGWFKILGPNASKSQQYMLQKQGGSLMPQYQNLSPILKTK